MRIGWKVLLPFSLFWVVLVAGLLIAFPSLADHFQSWRN
jgi:NADH-quinone oxidoreductase subunit H